MLFFCFCLHFFFFQSQPISKPVKCPNTLIGFILSYRITIAMNLIISETDLKELPKELSLWKCHQFSVKDFPSHHSEEFQFLLYRKLKT